MLSEKELKELMLNTIRQSMGKAASRNVDIKQLQKMSTLELLGVMHDMAADPQSGIIDQNSVADTGCHNADEDTEWEDYFGGCSRMECMPAIEVKKYTLRIKLRGISPSIWRKIEVPSSIKLTSLANIILVAMGWQGTHLHQFAKAGRPRELYPTAEKPDEEDSLWFSNTCRHWGGDYTIAHLLKAAKDKVLFEYDFGDSWEHDVALSKVDDYADGEQPRVRLVSGKRACPPEDCGGVWGYYELCEAIQHPYSARAKELKGWLGYKFDPEEFWLEDTQEEVDGFNPEAEQ